MAEILQPNTLYVFTKVFDKDDLTNQPLSLIILSIIDGMCDSVFFFSDGSRRSDVSIDTIYSYLDRGYLEKSEVVPKTIIKKLKRYAK